MSERKLNSLGAFQLSKHTKIFQDAYIKMGVLTVDSSRVKWDKFLQELRHKLQQFPSMVNWKIGRP